jgi:carboxymethylenebutenolidase
VAELVRILTDNDKEFEVHSYDNAGHGFFAVERPGYRSEAAADGWQRITAFLHRHLGG